MCAGEAGQHCRSVQLPGTALLILTYRRCSLVSCTQKATAAAQVHPPIWSYSAAPATRAVSAASANLDMALQVLCLLGTHSCTHALMRSVARSLAHSLTHLLPHPPTHPPTQSLTHSLSAFWSEGLHAAEVGRQQHSSVRYAVTG